MALVLLLALVARGGILWAHYDQLASDPDGYRDLATNLVRHGVFGAGDKPTAYRPPLYPLLLTLCVAGQSHWQACIACLHLLLGLLTVYGTVRLAERCQLGSFAWLAGALVACDPILLNQSTVVMTETLAALLAVMALGALAAADAKCTAGRAAWVGVVLGLACLCRPTFLLWSVVCVAALAVRRGGWRISARCVALVLASSGMVLGAWVTRNAVQLGHAIATTSHGGYTLLLGNNPGYYEFLKTARWGAVWSADELDRSLNQSRTPDEFTNDRREYAEAWQTIRQQPAMFLYASLLRVGHFWGVLPHQTSAGESTLRRLMRWSVALWYAATFALIVVAVTGGEVRLLHGPWLWGSLLGLSFTATHAIYWSDLRMRAPLVPALSIAAAAGARQIAARLTRRKSLTEYGL